MKRRGQKELSKQGDEQNKFIHYNETHTDTLKNIANSINNIIVCVCVCVSNTTKLQRITYINCLSFYGWRQSLCLRLEKVSWSMYILNVCEAHPCCCYLTSVELQWRECVAAAKKLCKKEKECLKTTYL